MLTIKRILLVLLVTFSVQSSLKAQFTYGTTGLLNMPTADMQQDKTFMFGGSFLEKHTTPTRWFYNTYNYYINITFFPWMEIAYTCTLHKAFKDDPYMSDGFWVPSTYGKFVNQDRNFSARFRIWKEGWWKSWTPQLVIGGNDVLNGSWSGLTVDMETKKANGFYSRYYIAATKHIDFHGEIGMHLAYVYNKRKEYPLNGPCFGINYIPSFHKRVNFMAEYDSKSINIGSSYTFWKDHINIIAELNRCKYPSIGVFFKVHL